MEDPWQYQESLADTNMHMLNEQILCDVTFIAGKNKQPVKAHRFVLASRSPVFFAMFCGPMSEKTESVAVPDISATTLKNLFRYMYSGVFDVNSETVMPLLYAANKYDVPGLVQACQRYLKDVMTPANVCEILQQAVHFGDLTMINECHKMLALHGKDALESEGFMFLAKDSLKNLLELNMLNMVEEDVYSNCIRWAKEQCRKGGQEGNDAQCERYWESYCT